jgi:hypothetical protein
LNRAHSSPVLPLVLLALAGADAQAAGGEPLGTDLFAGYSFARVSDTSRHGASLALGFHALGPIAGFVDAGAHWGRESGVTLSDLTLAAGPGIRFGGRGGTLVFVRVLAGVLRDRASISVLGVDISEGSTRFAVLAGGGVDVRIAARLALRAQGDYLWNDVPNANKSGLRVSGGVVYRFGAAP